MRLNFMFFKTQKELFMATRAVDGNGGNSGVGGLDASATLYHSLTDVSTTEAAGNVLNQTDTPSSQTKEKVGYQVDEKIPDSCCQKVGDCFKSFWTTVKKTKTHNE
jgi:hypothetical protein